MYFASPDELKKILPIQDGVWNKEYLYEYLIWSSNVKFEKFINHFFEEYLNNEELADLLLQAQKNEVCWKRPFPNDECLEWMETMKTF